MSDAHSFGGSSHQCDYQGCTLRAIWRITYEDHFNGSERNVFSCKKHFGEYPVDKRDKFLGAIQVGREEK